MKLEILRAFGTALSLSAVVTISSADAADLSRHGRHNRTIAAAAFNPCGMFEPGDYKPRIRNFGEPGCYAARVDGISSVLYDHSVDLDRSPND